MSARIEALHTQKEAAEQLLLDINPDSPLYWLLTGEVEAIDKTIALLRQEEKIAEGWAGYDPRMDPCSPDFDPTSWMED